MRTQFIFQIVLMHLMERNLKNKLLPSLKKNTDFLINKGCKIIVVACNTATTNAIKILRKTYTIPFIGIEPAIKPASLKTKTKSIGILATKGTLSSQLFEKTSSSIRETNTITEVIGKGLVELIESGKMYSTEMTDLLEKYLHPLLKKNIDCLVLGCTHYPYLIPQIKSIIGNEIQIIDSGEAVARQTKTILEKHNLIQINTNEVGYHQFYSNQNKGVLVDLLKNSTMLNYKIKERKF